MSDSLLKLSKIVRQSNHLASCIVPPGQLTSLMFKRVTVSGPRDIEFTCLKNCIRCNSGLGHLSRAFPDGHQQHYVETFSTTRDGHILVRNAVSRDFLRMGRLTIKPRS